MIYRILADAVLILHFAFIAFALLGGLLVWRWPGLAWLHLPAAAWAAGMAFVLFVVLGGLLALKWRRVAWVHVPVALYGAAIEFVGFICPLTPLEVSLRRRGGEAGYEGGFIEHVVEGLIYPGWLTREIQIGLGAVVLAVNVACYWRVLRRH